MPDQAAIHRGRDFEQRVADTLQGNIVPGSGNKFYAKSDVTAHGLRISCKSELNLTWNKVKDHLYEAFEMAYQSGDIPVLALDGIKNEDIIVMRLSDLAKAFADGIKIPEAYESKGLKKRKEIDIPLMLRE